MPNLPRQYLLLSVAILLLVIVVFAESCRKMDRVLNKNPALSETEAKFFSNHRSADAKESALVDFFQRRNDSSHFVETAVQRIGYPYGTKRSPVKRLSRMAVQETRMLI